MSRLTAEQKKMYEKFMADFPFCFACGWSDFGPWRTWGFPKIDNAHIVGGAGRQHDRRAIIRLCQSCHKSSHGERVVMGNKDGVNLIMPKLTFGMLIGLKKEIDPIHYDQSYLMSIRTQRYEELVSESLPGWHLEHRMHRKVPWFREGFRAIAK